jgi:dihydroneopterin aldolase
MGSHPGPSDRILVRQLRLWAHVGVLDGERERGQWFELDLELALDLSPAGRSDRLADTFDYGALIVALQRQARQIRCRTLEHYAQEILQLLEQCVAHQLGPRFVVPARLELRKCAAPVPGFTGSVGVRCSRSWPVPLTTAAGIPRGDGSQHEGRDGAGPSS